MREVIPTVHDQVAVAPRAHSTSFGLKLAIVLYLLGTLVLFGVVFVDLWRPNSAIMDAIFASEVDSPNAVTFRSLSLAIVGAGFGGVTFSLLAFNEHVAFKQDFQHSFSWGFFYSPWVASVFGLMVFAFVKGGMLVLAGGTQTVGEQELANLGHLSLGFLAGFGWATFSEKLQRLITELFGSSAPPAPPEEKTAPEATLPRSG